MAMTIRDMMAGPSFGCGTTPYRKNVSEMDSAGTSEGATKGWDTRGRGKAMHDVLLNRGFKLRNRGKQENSYRRSSGSSLHVVTTTPSGWQHDYGSLRTGNVVTNAEGTDEKDLDAYLGKRGFGK